MRHEEPATVVAAGLRRDIVAAMRARLAGATVLEPADTTELRAQLRDAPDVALLGGWALGSDPEPALRALRKNALRGMTKVVACLTTPRDPSMPPRLVADHGVSRLLFLPLAVEEVLRLAAELTGGTVTPSPDAPPDSRARRGRTGPNGARSRQLLLVGAEPALAEGVEAEGTARGLQVVAVPDPAAAREAAATEPPAVVAVVIEPDADPAPALDLLAALTEAEPPSSGLVLAQRDATAVRVEAVRRGARRFLELPASPATIVTQAIALVGRGARPPYRILAVDDDPRILEALRRVLGWSEREVHTMDDPLRFWSMLEEVRPELLVLDVEMPHVTGLELARAVRSDPRWAHLPIIFLSTRTDAESIRRGYAAGGDDHVGKPIVAEELETRVRNRLERGPARDDSGDTDVETGVGSRQRTADLLTRYLHLARRRGDVLAVGSVTVDDVASIARSHGPAAVEAAWRAAAQQLARSLRGEDLVGRWSEDELVVVLYGSTRDDAAQRVASILSALAEREVTVAGALPFGIACSAGVAQYPEDGHDVDALYGAATRTRVEAQPR